jgi:3'-5' exoribonuclease
VKRTFVSEIKRDSEVNDFFLVVKKGVYSSKNNTKYMSLRLKDATGQIDGKVWDRVDELSAGFDRNDIVYVESKARMYQDSLQLTITGIRKEETELSADQIREFLPEAGPGTTQLKEELFRIMDEVEDPHLRAVLQEIKSRKTLLDKFCLFPASVGIHHVSVGGLLEHSVSLARMAKSVANQSSGDKDVLITGAILHDIGKVEELTFKGGFGYSDRGRLLGHISLGIMMVDDLTSAVEGFPADLADVLRHIILSHHGETEWGSPKKPMCIEAIVIHYLDNLDAKVMGVREHMRESMENERWTQFHRTYEQRFYKMPER